MFNVNLQSTLLAFTMFFIAPVGAEIVQVSAMFKPDPARPNNVTFENTTISTGYCAIVPSECLRWNIFSIGTQINLDSNRAISANHADPRQGAMFNMPAGWVDVRIYDEAGKESLPVQVRIAGVGATYVLSERAQVLIGRELSNYYAHNALWAEGDWLAAARPCSDGPYSDLDDYSWAFFWMTPVEGVCSKKALYDIPQLSYSGLNFAYEMRTPNPLKMTPGIYTGTHVYTVGPGAHFDMGTIMQPSDSVIQIDFTLTVDHVLSVEIPPGGNNVELIPHGGWQVWLNQGRKPVRLFRDQTFNIWASTPFKMQLRCENEINNTCSLQDEVGNRVPLHVAVSLPNGLVDATGAPINKRPLQLDGVGTEKFEPSMFIDRRPGTLHFEVDKDGVAEMLDFGGSKYAGQVTVVWDSEV